MIVTPLPTGDVPAAFLELPRLVYAGDPSWLPEEPDEVMAAFGPRNPWFAAGAACAFVEPGAARAVAFQPAGLVIEGQPAAFFGYLESTGAAAATGAVLGAVAEWARARGARVLHGPINFATTLGYRVVLSLEDGATPFPGEPWTPRSYAPLLERLGYRLAMRYLTAVMTAAEARAALAANLGALAHVEAQGYRIEALTPERWRERTREVHALSDLVYETAFGYTPVPYELFEARWARPMGQKLCPETSILIRGPEDDAAALWLSYPDYGPLCCQGAGAARLPLAAVEHRAAWPRLAERPGVTCVGKTAGVSPRHRRRGLYRALAARYFQAGLERYQRFHLALIREDNPIRACYEPFSTTRRWYGLYARALS